MEAGDLPRCCMQPFNLLTSLMQLLPESFAMSERTVCVCVCACLITLNLLPLYRDVMCLWMCVSMWMDVGMISCLLCVCLCVCVCACVCVCVCVCVQHHLSVSVVLLSLIAAR